MGKGKASNKMEYKMWSKSPRKLVSVEIKIIRSTLVFKEYNSAG